MTKNRSPNDNRSNAFNPNNSANKSAKENRSDQLNPNNTRYQGQKGRK